MADPKTEETLAQLQDIIARFGSKTQSLESALDNLAKRTTITSNGFDRVNNITERLNRSRLAEKQVIDSATNEMKDLIKAYREGKITQGEYDDAVDAMKQKIRQSNNLTQDQIDIGLKAVDAGEKRAQAELNTEKRIAAFGATTSAVTTVFSKTIRGLYEGFTTTDPLSGASKILETEVRGTGQTAGFLGSALETAGQAAKTSGNTWVKATGYISNFLGKGLQIGGAALNKFADVIPLLNQNLIEFRDSFKSAAEIGAVFGGGMTELRNIAGNAGLKLQDLVSGVAQNVEAFNKAGLSTLQATRLIGTFGKGLTTGNESLQLFALGFTDMKDRVALAGSALAQARSEGMSLAQAQANLSKLTVEYGADLKVLQSVVGKDAEAAREKARLESMRAGLIAQLTPEQRKSFQAYYASLERFGSEAPALQMSLIQRMADASITSQKVLINDPARQMIEEMAAGAKSGKEYGESVADASSMISKAAESMRGPAGATAQALDRAAIASYGFTDPLIEGSSKLANAFTSIVDNGERGAEALASTQKALSNPDEITKTVAKITESQYALAVTTQQVATSGTVIGNFATLLQKSLEPLEKMIEKIKEFANVNSPTSIVDAITKALPKTGKEVGGAVGSVGGGLAGGIAGRAAGAAAGAALGTLIFPGIGTAIGGILGGIAGAGVGGYIGSKAGGAVGEGVGEGVSNLLPKNTDQLPQFAAGGIARGPTTGFPAMLHGRELVLPLPDQLSLSEISKLTLGFDPNTITTLFNEQTKNMQSQNMLTDKITQSSDKTADLIETLNSKVDDLINSVREVAVNTDRTARGVA